MEEVRAVPVLAALAAFHLQVCTASLMSRKDPADAGCCIRSAPAPTVVLCTVYVD